MAWTGDVRREVKREFAAANRLRRGIRDRVSDEGDEIPLGPRAEPVVTRRRRIVGVEA